MSRRTAAWLAWPLCVAALALLVAGMAVSYLLRRSSSPASADLALWLELLLLSGFAAYPTVGALVASRRPGNAIGWLLCAVGLAAAAVSFTEPYSLYARAVPAGSLPGVEIAAFLDSVNPGVRLAVFIPLYFPDGRLPSRRWLPVAWLAGGGVVLNVAYFWLPDGLSEIVLAVSFAFLFAGLLGSVASVVHRLRRARGEERQQIKWLVYAASLMIVGALGSLGSSWLSLPSWPGVFWYVTLCGFAAIPIATGIAILRYRLYDIDLIINRTLVYGSLTFTLIAVYFGGIVVLQRLFVVLTGERSTLAVVASTLLIAALFNPLRRRVQGFVDRRFYRKKYDAAKTLAAFNSRLRDETDLGTLCDDLVGVARGAVQPEHVSLWLRPAASRKDGRTG